MRSGDTTRISWAIRCAAASVAGIDREVEPCRHSHRAEDAELVFREPRDGVADRAEQLRIEIRPAADVVNQLALHRVEEHAVDREVAALCVFLWRRKDDRVRPTAVGVGAVRAERRHLNGEPLARVIRVVR